MSQTQRPSRTPQEIEAELAAARSALATSIDQITETVAPANLARRAQAAAVATLQTPDGAWDPKKLAIVAGVGLVLVVYLVRRRHS